MSVDLERELIARAWTDPAFARALQDDPAAALAQIGVSVPEGLRVNVRVQRRDTLYYVIPPAVGEGGDPEGIANQMDLWRSADEFVWVLPQHAKVGLLAMRQQHRRWSFGAEEGAP